MSWNDFKWKDAKPDIKPPKENWVTKHDFVPRQYLEAKPDSFLSPKKEYKDSPFPWLKK